MNAIKIEFQGAIVYVSTPEEAAAFLRAALNGSARDESRHAPRGQLPKRERETAGPKREALQWAESMLIAVRDAPPTGATSETVRTALRASSGKAAGGRSAMVNQALRDLGYQQHHVYNNDRTSAGRFWKPKKQLPEALSAVQSALSKAS